MGVVFDFEEAMKNPPKRTPFAVVRDRETGIVMLHIRPYTDADRAWRAKEKRRDITKEVAPGWVVDFAEDGSAIEIEVLNPSKHFPPEVLALLPPEFEGDE